VLLLCLGVLFLCCAEVAQWAAARWSIGWFADTADMLLFIGSLWLFWFWLGNSHAIVLVLAVRGRRACWLCGVWSTWWWGAAGRGDGAASSLQWQALAFIFT
jgi:hypothetical protein